MIFLFLNHDNLTCEDITQQYVASTRDQLIVFRKRLNKLNELRLTKAAASGTVANSLGISEVAIGEQFSENAQVCLSFNIILTSNIDSLH